MNLLDFAEPHCVAGYSNRLRVPFGHRLVRVLLCQKWAQKSMAEFNYLDQVYVTPSAK
jgi:hypothetical protein